VADDEKNEKDTDAEEQAKPKRRARKKPEGEDKPKAKPRAKKADDAPAEEKPKRTRRKKTEAADEDATEGAQAKDDAEATEEPTADEVAEQAKPDEVDKPKRRRRGAAEVSAASESRKASAARRDADGKVIVRAKARYVRTAPRKARLVIDHIRGKSVDEARAILIHTPRAASRDVLKLLDSAIANAENNHELVADELKIDRVFVDEGPTLKRYRPRALGRATQIRKRTSHMTILLTPKE
jgi:ribosomal protein L22